MLLLMGYSCSAQEPDTNRLSNNKSDSANSSSSNNCVLLHKNEKNVNILNYVNASGQQDSVELGAFDSSIEAFWHGPIALIGETKFANAILNNSGISFELINVDNKTQDKTSKTQISRKDKESFFLNLKKEYHISAPGLNKAKYLFVSRGMIRNNKQVAVNYYTVDFYGNSVSWGLDTTLFRFSVVIIRDCHFEVRDIITIPNAMISEDLIFDESGDFLLYTHLQGVEEEGITYQNEGIYLFDVKGRKEIKLPVAADFPIYGAFFSDGLFQLRNRGRIGIDKYYISPSEQIILHKSFPFNENAQLDNSLHTFGKLDDLSTFDKLRF